MSKFEWFWDWCVGWEPSDKAITKEPDEKSPSSYCDYCKSKMPCSSYNWGVECKEEIKIKENIMKNPRFERRYYKGEDYKMDLKEIVLKLNGNISPKGDASVDNERFENLKNLCQLVNELVFEIDNVSHNNRDSYEHSVKRSVEYADKFLKDTLGICE